MSKKVIGPTQCALCGVVYPYVHVGVNVDWKNFHDNICSAPCKTEMRDQLFGGVLVDLFESSAELSCGDTTTWSAGEGVYTMEMSDSD